MTEHIKIRQKLSEIPDLNLFTKILENSTLSELDKCIIKLYYLEDKNLSYIGDELGYSESWIKKKHSKILKKLGKLL